MATVDSVASKFNVLSSQGLEYYKQTQVEKTNKQEYCSQNKTILICQ